LLELGCSSSSQPAASWCLTVQQLPTALSRTVQQDMVLLLLLKLLAMHWTAALLPMQQWM
jgi:hypothetical protein